MIVQTDKRLIESAHSTHIFLSLQITNDTVGHSAPSCSRSLCLTLRHLYALLCGIFAPPTKLNTRLP